MASPQSPVGPAHIKKENVTLTVRSKQKVGALGEILEVFATLGLNLNSIHSTLSGNECAEFLVEVESSSEEVAPAIKKLEEMTGFPVAGSGLETPWYPRHISDMDGFTHKVMSYGEDLDADHPGFTDDVYRHRRLAITDIARNYKHGEAIPNVEYTEEENKTWSVVYKKIMELVPTHACSQYRQIISLLEHECGFGPDAIPQLEVVSKFLKRHTGFSIRPVSGLLSSRDFLNAIAFRVFHSTQYIRHSSRPLYTPEPDVCHELIGHVPLFADKDFADFSQAIGIASLGASDEDIAKLASCYWFTVEFGLCEEVLSPGTAPVPRVFGAGIISSFGELEYALSGKPELAPFEPSVAAVTPYPITSYQPKYFVAQSFSDAKNKLLAFAKSLSSSPALTYNPYTQSVVELDTKAKVAEEIRSHSSAISSLTEVLVSAK